VRLVIGAATDVGRVRDGNEDAYLIDDTIGLVAVADGIGGHRAGEVASATAIEALRAAFASGRTLRESIEDANAAVFAKAQTDVNLRGMGTTLTVGTLVAGDTILLGHVGDSRAYLLHDGELRQVTVDHSLVEELVQEGRLTADEAAVHPQRSIITRSIGTDALVDVDVYPVELALGDRLLLCSDGLTDMVQTDAIAATLRREVDPQRAANQLVDAANQAGGVDNITVVVVAVTDEAPVQAASEPVEQLEAAAVETPPAEPGERRRRRARGVGRALLWALPIVIVLGVAVGAVGWYARNHYYVGVDDGQVTVFKGVPGGLVGWNPTIEERTPLALSDLRPAARASVEKEQKFSSRDDATAFVARLRNQTTTTSSTTTTAPTTTVPPTTVPPTTAAPPAA
jgi:protein phosphatase